MATVLKTYTDTNYSSSTYKKTWVVSYAGTDVTASSSTFTFTTPTISLNFTGTSGTYRNTVFELFFSTPLKNIGQASIGNNKFMWCDPASSSDAYISGSSGTFFTATKRTQKQSGATTLSHTQTLNTSDFFTNANKTQRTIDVTAKSSLIQLKTNTNSSGTGNSSEYSNNTTGIEIGVIGTITLNAPPTFTASPLGGNTGSNYYVGTVVSTTISDLSAKYGGDISSAVLTIGNQSTARTDNGALLIGLNATGTFTPTVTVTDSRGQTTTQTLTPITVTNRPPSFNASQLSLNTTSAWVGLTTATTTISNVTAYNGASVNSVVLKIGSQTVSRNDNGTLSILLNAAGTFTPTVTATDTNGQTTTVTLNSITVVNRPPSLNSTQVAFYEGSTAVNSAYATLTKGKVTISNLTAYNSATITSVVLKVGSQTSTARTTNGDIEMTLNNAGTFTPTVVVTDSVGSTTTITLNSITVNAYTKPSVTINALTRYNNSTNKPDNEGTVAVITAAFTYTSGAGTLVAPTVKVDGTTKSCTWYTTKASDGTLSNQISSWSSISSGTKVYGKVSGTYDYTTNYTVSVTPTDTHTSGSAVSANLVPAFYTIDVQHGGKEIAFGRPANDDVSGYTNGLFHCGMAMKCDDNIDIASGKKYKINGNNLSASDVGALPSNTTYVSGVKGNEESTYRSGQVNVTPANVGAVALADKYTRSSAGDLAWTNQTDGDAKVIAKSALAFWNGAYAGSGSNLSKCSTGNIIGSSGGTMTGQLLTSFKTSVAMGSYGSAQSTVDGLVGEIRYSSGAAGSANITTAYTKNSITIPTGWYNFMYMPHRSGGVNGSGTGAGDNISYGNLLLFGMNNTNGRFIIRVSSGSIQEICKLVTTAELNQTPSSSGLSPYSSRCTISNGGIYSIGNQVFVTMKLKIAASLSANNYWTIVGGFPAPSYEQALACSGISKNGTALSAYVKSDGYLVITTDNAALASGDYVTVGGWYLKA